MPITRRPRFKRGHKGGDTRAAQSRNRKGLEAYLCRLETGGLKLPADPLRPTRISLAIVAHEAGIPRSAIAKTGSALRRQLDARIETLGLELRTTPARTDTMTLAEARARGIAEITRDCRETESYAKGPLNALKNAMAVVARRSPERWHAEAIPAFARFEQDVEAGLVKSGKALMEHVVFVRSLLPDDSEELPDQFDTALAVVMARAQMQPVTVARTVGIAPTLLNRWARGDRVPDRRNVAIVTDIEKLLGLPPKTLSARIRRRRRGQASLAEGTFPEEFRGPEMRETRRLIAARLAGTDWIEDEAERHTLMRRLDAEIAESRRVEMQRHAMREDPYGLRAWPDELEREWQDYARYATSDDPADAAQRLRPPLRQSSLKKYRHNVSYFLGYLAHRRKVPLAPDCLSLALLTVEPLLSEYVYWRRKRNAQFLGEAMHTDGDVDFLTYAASLINQADGYLFRHPEYQEKLLRLAETAGVPQDEPSQSWADYCETAFRRIGALRDRMGRAKKQGRNPFSEIAPILDLPRPLDPIRRMIAEMQQEADAMAKPQRYLLDRDRIIVRILSVIPFRRETMVQMCYDPEAETHLVCGQGKFCWRVPKSLFKNEPSGFFDKGAFTREIPDVDGLYEDLRYYLDEVRPALLEGEESDAFIVNHSGNPRYGAATFGNKLSWLTRRYVGELAPPHLRVPGLRHLSAHAFRHVVATAHLKASGRFEVAADAILVHPSTAERHYARWKPSDRNEKRLEAAARIFSGAGPTRTP